MGESFFLRWEFVVGGFRVFNSLMWLKGIYYFLSFSIMLINDKKILVVNVVLVVEVVW